MQVDRDDTVSILITDFSLITTFTSQSSKNIFDDLPDLAPTSADYRDELERYLATDVENVKDALLWWYERRDRVPSPLPYGPQLLVYSW
jgi:hypothetical protein